MTHDHAEDAALCDAALRRPDLGFIGLIGSRRQVDSISGTAARQSGTRAADLERITSPIGLSSLRSKTPAVIALSVAAQLAADPGSRSHASPLSQPAPSKDAMTLYRATYLHTPGNPFHDAHALQIEEDGGLLVQRRPDRSERALRRGPGRAPDGSL